MRATALQHHNMVKQEKSRRLYVAKPMRLVQSERLKTLATLTVEAAGRAFGHRFQTYISR